MVTRELIHKGENGTEYAVELGAKAENVVFGDGKTLETKIEKIQGYICHILVPVNSWENNDGIYSMHLDLDPQTYPGKFTENTAIDIDIDLQGVQDSQQHLNDYNKLIRVVVNNDSLYLEANEKPDGNFYIKMKGIGLKAWIPDWENRTLEDWEG